MSAKHTPGPWKWVRARTMYHLHGPDGYFGVSVRADSRATDVMGLIAAAPKLLARLAAICEMQQANYGDGMSTHIALIGLCSEARAVIAEATGEQP